MVTIRKIRNLNVRIMFLVIGTLVSILCIGCTSQKQKNSEGLYGKVKTVTHYIATVEFGDLKKTTPFQIDQYDENGNLIQWTSFQNGTMNYKKFFQYSSNGKILESVGYNKQGENGIKENYTYDKNDSVSVYEMQTKGRFAYNEKKTYRYDDKCGKIAEENTYFNGELYLKTTYSYDNRGNEIEHCTYNSNGVLILKVITTYNNLQRVSEISTYDGTGNLEKKEHSFEYDQKGNRLQSILYNTYLKSTLKKTFQYDTNGNITESCQLIGEDILEKETFVRDEKGNEIKRLKYKGPSTVLSSGSITEYEYYE